MRRWLLQSLREWALDDTDDERKQVSPLIAEARQKLRDLEARTKQCLAMHQTPIALPTVEHIRASALRMAEVILSAQESDAAADRRIANELLRRIIGGRIVLEQGGDRKPMKGFLRGTFPPRGW